MTARFHYLKSATPSLNLSRRSSTGSKLLMFAGASGDFNPIHFDDESARANGLPSVVAHGILSMAILGRLLTAWVRRGCPVLGAGLIFREGLSVRGLNTAATLWCSAAIGVLAGAGYPAHAAVATGFIIFVNLALRPVVRFINRQSLTSTELEICYLISATCRSPDEAHIRALLLQGLAAAGLTLRRLESNDLEGVARVVVIALVTAPHRIDADVERIVGRLSLEPTVSAARWQAEVQLDSEGQQSPAFSTSGADRQVGSPD